MKVNRRRGALTVACLIAATTLVPALRVDPAGAAPTAAAIVAGQAAVAGCDLNESGHVRDEFAECTQVEVDFAARPDIGATSVVEVAVTAVDDVERGTLTLRVSDRFEIVDPGSFTPAGVQPSGVGQLATVDRGVSLVANETRTFHIKVRGARSGTGVVQARFATAGSRYDGGSEASAEIGQHARVSPHGLPTTKALDSAPKAPKTTGTARYRPAPIGGEAAAALLAPDASCATGRWTFNDEAGLQNPSANVQVQVWDDDSDSGDDLLVTTVTGFDGSYDVCFESSDGEGGGQEVYVRFKTENLAWRVRDTPGGNNSYIWSSAVQSIPNPGTARFGTLQPADLVLHRALHAYDGINRLWLWHASVHNRLDNPGDNRQMIVNWTPTSTDTLYDNVTNNVHLAAADPDADHVTIHEGAHALMDAIYDDDMPPNPNCNPHNIFTPSSPGCAWTEGWAEWVPARVLNDPVFRFPNDIEFDLEGASWIVPATSFGDVTEGRVAGALIDLSDRTNETWDRSAEGGVGAASEEIYATNLTEVSDTFAEFFILDRPGEGDTSFIARATLFQNTIDYTHRDPLTSGEALVRPSLTNEPFQHNYSFQNPFNSWGAVAVLPPPGVAYDLRVYGDTGLTDRLATSQKGPGDVEYVVMDGNHRVGTFFPQVLRRAGSGPYQIEGDAGGSLLPRGTTTLSFDTGELIRMFEIEVSPSATEYIRVVPNSGLDVDLHLHDSDGSPAGSVQDRSRSLAASVIEPVGAPEALAYRPSESDRDGVVITNESGRGSFTVYHDTVGPTNPSVVIDGGSSSTYGTDVELALAAQAANGDGNTPVTDMQISTDGTFDTEPWQPYATTANATLPGGFGTRTVSARYRNAAGAISTTASDTIRRVAVPECAGRTATVSGFGVIEGTPGADVIVGGPSRDTIRGNGGNDLICALGGTDTILAGSGADRLLGGGGNDTLNSRDNVRRNDAVNGGGGTDVARVDQGDHVTRVP